MSDRTFFSLIMNIYPIFFPIFQSQSFLWASSALLTVQDVLTVGQKYFLLTPVQILKDRTRSSQPHAQSCLKRSTHGTRPKPFVSAMVRCYKRSILLPRANNSCLLLSNQMVGSWAFAIRNVMHKPISKYSGNVLDGRKWFSHQKIVGSGPLWATEFIPSWTGKTDNRTTREDASALKPLHFNGWRKNVTSYPPFFAKWVRWEHIDNSGQVPEYFLK